MDTQLLTYLQIRGSKEISVSYVRERSREKLSDRFN